LFTGSVLDDQLRYGNTDLCYRLSCVRQEECPIFLGQTRMHHQKKMHCGRTFVRCHPQVPHLSSTTHADQDNLTFPVRGSNDIHASSRIPHSFNCDCDCKMSRLSHDLCSTHASTCGSIQVRAPSFTCFTPFCSSLLSTN
jgi:hypothetical protein